MKHFYSHIVSIEIIHKELAILDLSETEKKELASLAESTVHHSILDRLLSALTDDHKKHFLKLLAQEDHATVWKFLRETIEGVEEQIKQTARLVLRELQKDIHEVKKREKK